MFMSRSFLLYLYRYSPTKSVFFWGVPQPVELLAGYSRCHLPDPLPSPPPALSILPPKLPASHRNRKSLIYFPPPRLITLSRPFTCRCVSSAILASHRQGHVSISLGLGPHILKMGLESPIDLNYYLSSPMASQPIYLWGVVSSFD